MRNWETNNKSRSTLDPANPYVSISSFVYRWLKKSVPGLELNEECSLVTVNLQGERNLNMACVANSMKDFRLTWAKTDSWKNLK
jgi:hypothetical protein